MKLLERLVDERFLAHRRHSTSVAGMIAAAFALLLFLWRHYADHVWSWDLFAVGALFVAIKLALMAWHLFND
jgi:hypothetical protein